MKDEYPITKEEIARLRERIQIGDKITIGHKLKDEDRGIGTVKRYKAAVVEKYKHLVLCEYFRHGHRFLESVRYVQIIQGDGAWLA